MVIFLPLTLKPEADLVVTFFFATALCFPLLFLTTTVDFLTEVGDSFFLGLVEAVLNFLTIFFVVGFFLAKLTEALLDTCFLALISIFLRT